MGLFGGSGDTSGSYSGGNDTFGSKLRSPSSELDFSDSATMGTLGGSTGGSDDIQTRIQIETQKAELVGQVNFYINGNLPQGDICSGPFDVFHGVNLFYTFLDSQIKRKLLGCLYRLSGIIIE